jgi:hypothetical protein
VPGSGGQHYDISGPDGNGPTVLAAQPNAGLAARDSQDLMRSAVEVMVIIDAVAPSARPIIPLEDCFEPIGETGIRRVRPTIDQYGHPTVRDASIVFEPVFLDLDARRFGSHGRTCPTDSSPQTPAAPLRIRHPIMAALSSGLQFLTQTSRDITVRTYSREPTGL